MSEIEHEVQLSILRELLYKPLASFTDLNINSLPNYHFSYHLKQVVAKNFVEKVKNKYRLTRKGKIFTSKLNSVKAEIFEQPKIGVSLFIKNSESEVLLDKRKYQPNKGLVGFHSEKVKINETLREAARRCLKGETGLSGRIRYAGILRLIRSKINKFPLDVVLIFFEVDDIEGDLLVETDRSENIWVQISELESLEDTFPNFDKDIELFKGDRPFFSERVDMEEVF